MRSKGYLVFSIILVVSLVIAGSSQAAVDKTQHPSIEDTFRAVLQETISKAGLSGAGEIFYSIDSSQAYADIDCGPQLAQDINFSIIKGGWGTGDSNANEITFHGYPGQEYISSHGNPYEYIYWWTEEYSFGVETTDCLHLPGARTIAETFFDVVKAAGLLEVSGSTQPTQPLPQPTDDPGYDDETCEAVECSHLPVISCDDSGQYSLSNPGCDSGRCWYFENEYCDNGCDQNTGMCMEAEACEATCPDHCEGNTAFSAMGCEGGECEWVERECPFGCDASLPGMCVQAEGDIVLLATRDGFNPQQQALTNPDASGSVTIGGQVVDQKSGEPIEGAMVAVVEGAQLMETITDEFGYYEIIALGNSSEVMSSAEVNFELTPLSVQVELVLEDVPMYPAGSSIVESTMRVAAAVYDPNGNLLGDRELTLAALTPGNDTWGSFSGVSDTNEHGYQVSTLTAGTFDLGTIVGSGQVPVRVQVTDTATGMVGEAIFNVTQIEMEVDYYPVLATCADCGPYPVIVTLKHPLGDTMANVSIIAGLDGDDGFLTTEMFGTSGSKEISLMTNDRNQVTFYFKPQMGDLTQEKDFTIYVVAESLGVIEAVPIRAEPLDIALAKFEPVSFSGRVGDYAYFNVGVKDLKHPNAPLNRLGLGTHSPIKYILTIRQTYPELDLATSINYGEQLHLVEDGQGGFRLKDSNSNPPSPHITPIYEGTNVYQVDVVAVDSISGNPVYDGFPRNNDTAIIVDAGNPGDWFHTIMVDGVLTPHTKVQAVIKCAASFIPPVGATMAAIDASSEAYKAGFGSSQDSFALFQKTVDRLANHVGDAADEAIAVNNALRAHAVIGKDMAKVKEVTDIGKKLGIGAKLLKVVGYVGNLISCYKDYETAGVEEASLGMVIGAPVCCVGCGPVISTGGAANYQVDYESVNEFLIPFIQEMLKDFPDTYAVMVLASPESSAVLMTEFGPLEDVYAENGVYFYMLPVGTRYQVQLSNSDVVNVVVFGDSQGEQTEAYITFEQEVNPFDAVFEVSPQSDLGLAIDYDQDGTVDVTMPPIPITVDLTSPTIQLTSPTTEVEGFTLLKAEIEDLGSSGIIWESLQAFVDGVEISKYAEISGQTMQLPVSGLTAGEHDVRILVMDQAYNVAEASWTIQSIGYQSTFGDMVLIPAILFCGFGSIGTIILGVLVLRARKKSQEQPAGKNRRWMVFTAAGVILLCGLLGSVGLIFNLVDTSGDPYPGSANMYSIQEQVETPVLPDWAEPPTQAEIDAYWQDVQDDLILPEDVYITE